jgi:hypothetical protein
MVSDAPDTDLRDRQAILHPGDMSKGMPVRSDQVLIHTREILMRVELDDMGLFIESSKKRPRDRVISAQNDRKGTSADDLAHACRDDLKGALGIGGTNIDIAGVKDEPARDLGPKIAFTAVQIVKRLLHRKTQRMFADRAWPHAAAWQERRAFVERHPQHGNRRFRKLGDVFHQRLSKEGRNSGKGAVNGFHVYLRNESR